MTRTPHPTRISQPSLRLRCLHAALGLVLLLAGCGGGDFAEQFVKLITARFVPASVTLAPGGSAHVELEITCDRAGLDTPFGRLGVRIKLDPDRRLPAGVTATLPGTVPDSDGFALVPCNGAASDPELRIARVGVDIGAAAGAAAQSTTLLAYLEIEPLVRGEPSKDSTTAELALHIGMAATPSANLLVNPSFENPVELGALPTAPGNWRGDQAASVGTEMGIVPHSGTHMLKFQATGTASSFAGTTSQQWQIVDLSVYAAAISAGGVRADLGGWFNRVAGGEFTDRRFDLRVMAFDGSPAELPARYGASHWLAEATGPLVSVANQWQPSSLSLELPPGTTYLLVEIVASEDVFNDGEGQEFAGHYADDLSLVLMTPPGAAPWDY